MPLYNWPFFIIFLYVAGIRFIVKNTPCTKHTIIKSINIDIKDKFCIWKVWQLWKYEGHVVFIKIKIVGQKLITGRQINKSPIYKTILRMSTIFCVKTLYLIHQNLYFLVIRFFLGKIVYYAIYFTVSKTVFFTDDIQKTGIIYSLFLKCVSELWIIQTPVFKKKIISYKKKSKFFTHRLTVHFVTWRASGCKL